MRQRLDGSPTAWFTTGVLHNDVVMHDAPGALDAVFGALADPTRRAILARLAEERGDLTVGELAEPFRMSQPAVSRHLKVLEQAGLISRRRRRTARLSHLEGEALDAASEWLARYRAIWQERHDRLDELLTSLTSGPGADAESVADPAGSSD
jgi:DNA-binding transcriptional ArsR family regulator